MTNPAPTRPKRAAWSAAVRPHSNTETNTAQGHQFVVRARGPERDGGNQDRDEERGDRGLETQSQRHGKGRAALPARSGCSGFPGWRRLP